MPFTTLAQGSVITVPGLQPVQIFQEDLGATAPGSCKSEPHHLHLHLLHLIILTQEKRKTRQQEVRYQSLDDTRRRYQCLDTRRMSASATLQTFTTLHLGLLFSEGGKRAGMVRGSPRAP